MGAATGHDVVSEMASVPVKLSPQTVSSGHLPVPVVSHHTFLPDFPALFLTNICPVGTLFCCSGYHVNEEALC